MTPEEARRITSAELRRYEDLSRKPDVAAVVSLLPRQVTQIQRILLRQNQLISSRVTSALAYGLPLCFLAWMAYLGHSALPLDQPINEVVSTSLVLAAALVLLFPMASTHHSLEVEIEQMRHNTAVACLRCIVTLRVVVDLAGQGNLSDDQRVQLRSLAAEARDVVERARAANPVVFSLYGIPVFSTTSSSVSE